MKSAIYFTILVFFAKGFVFAQPGAYTGVLKFKVFKDGKMADLSKKDWKIILHTITDPEPAKPYVFPEYYEVLPKATPMGGLVNEDFSLELIFKSDTMKIFTPDFSSKDVILDSIPFKKGVFKIPQHLYDLEYMTNNTSRKYVPKINGNWDLFKKRTYNCLIEKVQDLDEVSQNTYTSYTNEFDYILIPDRLYYYFQNNVIIRTNDDENLTIYQIKDITEVSFWNKRLKENEFVIKSLFYKDSNLYAIIKKVYNSRTIGTSYGVYKLYFADEEIPKNLVTQLEQQQVVEDYNAVVKFIKKNPASWRGTDLNEIKSEYEKKVKAFKNE